MTFLNNQHLLVKFGDKLCGRIIIKDINIGKQLLILKSYTTIDNKPSNIVDINNSIGYCDIEIKDDGIYYTPVVFDTYKQSEGVIIETFKRDVLKVAGNGTLNNMTSICYMYISNNVNKSPLEIMYEFVSDLM